MAGIILTSFSTLKCRDGFDAFLCKDALEFGYIKRAEDGIYGLTVATFLAAAAS